MDFSQKYRQGAHTSMWLSRTELNGCESANPMQSIYSMKLRQKVVYAQYSTKHFIVDKRHLRNPQQKVEA